MTPTTNSFAMLKSFIAIFACAAISQSTVFAADPPVTVTNTTANPVPTVITNIPSAPVPAIITNRSSQPIPVSVGGFVSTVITNGVYAVINNTTAKPVPTVATDNPAFQPFQKNIYINIANGSSSGGDNGNVSPGTQTVTIPSGKRLVVQTVSMYRSGAISTQDTQIFINSSVGGSYSAFALPPAPPANASYSGATQPMTFYSDGGTQLLANAFRSGTTGAESDTITISGYLVNVP